MAYQALYRTYRPQFFREVVGQDVVVKTIQNSIATGKISHAYLFCGPRGTGKTTIARIFAKALNCEHPELNEPCNTCSSCHEISDSMSPDVVEIDAASNNGVDEIRDIREKVKYLPGGAKYRIYIIDEVHMLSAGAFNALLKTLEEPPKHVVFILATTEAQKLPATIISRCQRFDFKALSTSEIANKLRLVCGEEEAEITEEAIGAISEAAEGGLRDALSILDMAISYSDEKVTIEEVNLVTGSLSYDKVVELAQSFDLKDSNRALEIVHSLIAMGKEVSKVVSSLLQFYRDVLLHQNVDSPVYSKYIFEKESFRELAKTTPAERIFYYLDVLSDVQAKIRYSQTPRLFLEVAIIKMINTSNDDLNFKRRIEEIENQLLNFEPSVPHDEVVVDNEKVALLETKINKVINELNKLELHKLSEQVQEMMMNRGQVVQAVENPQVQKQIEHINENLLILKTSYNTLLNQLNQTSFMETHQEATVDVDKIAKDVLLKAQAMFIPYQEQLDQLKIQITAVQNKEFDGENRSEEIEEIKEKLIAIEKKIYQILSGELAQKAPPAVKKPKHADQIVLFKEDLTPITELSPSKVDVDFHELSKQTEETQVVDIKDESVEEEIPQEVEFVPEGEVAPTEEDRVMSVSQEELQVEETKNEPVEVQQQETVEEKPVVAVSTTYNPDGSVVMEKPHSQLVITPRKTESLFEQERQLMEKEMQAIRLTVVEEEPEAVEEKPSLEEEKPDRYLTYDAKIVENILHESRTEAARNDAKRINQFWMHLGRGIKDSELLGIVETLKEGKIVAVGNKELILSFKSAALCNQVMRKGFKNEVLKIFFDNLRETYNYIALPEHIWLEKRMEYINQYNIGIKYPKISPIEDPELVIIRATNEYKNPKEQIVNKAIKFFGDDIVKVE